MLFRKRVMRARIARLATARNKKAQAEAAEKTAAHDGSFRIVTYNVHRCRGLDGRTRPGRIVEVLSEIDADIIALQEVVTIANGRREDHQADFFAAEMGMHYCFGENRRFKGGGYGNLVLSRLPLISKQNFDLSRPGREERGCLRTDVVLDGSVLHVYNVHLGTSYLERRHQGRRLVRSDILVGEDLQGPRILLGDFNEWLRGLTSRLLTEHFGSVDIRQHLGRRRTYPGPLPLVHLDHIYFDEALLRLEGAVLHRSRKALIASDHLPLVADFHVDRSGVRASAS